MAAIDDAVKELATYCKSVPTDPHVIKSATRAVSMVGRRVAQAVEEVPADVVALAVLECGKELFDRRQSRNGIAGLDSTDFQPMRIARDPMKAAMPFLEPYMGPAVA